MLDDRFPGEPANKGWNRASIMFWSRKPYRSRIRREDLTLPKHLDGVRLLASCASGASAMRASRKARKWAAASRAAVFAAW